MTGLEILEKTQIMVLPNSAIIIGILIVIVPTIFIAIRDKFKKLRAIGYEIILGAIVVILLKGFHIADVPSGKYEYKAIIDESCSLIKFNEKYEIIKQNDDGTYTVKDIENTIKD